MSDFSRAQAYSSTPAFNSPAFWDSCQPSIFERALEKKIEEIKESPETANEAIKYWIENASPEQENDHGSALLDIMLGKSEPFEKILNDAIYDYAAHLVENQ